MAKKKLTKSQMSQLLAKDMISLTKKTGPQMYRLIPVHAPKVEKETSKGRTSKVDILKLREDILDEIRREQLNY